MNDEEWTTHDLERIAKKVPMPPCEFIDDLRVALTGVVWDRDFYRQTLVDLAGLIARRIGDPALTDALREGVAYSLANPPSATQVAVTAGGCPAP